MKQSAGDKAKQKILKAGLRLWPEASLTNVAKAAGMTKAAVLYHYPAGTLQDSIAEHAVAIKDSRVVVQLIGAGHKAAEGLSPSERIKHFNNV